MTLFSPAGRIYSMETQQEVALLYSGGPDSTTLLYDLLLRGNKVHALTFNFGEQESDNEKNYASKIIASQPGDVEHHIFDFSGPLREFYGIPYPQFLRKAASPQLLPTRSENVQPFGSTIALMLTASWALRRDLRDVYYAVHQNDGAFHDNHPEYFSLLGRVTAECEGIEYRMNFHTPYLTIPKADVIRLGNELGVPFESTWSCALGGAFHCGTCDPCVDRRMSFEVAGVEDPVHYVSNILPSAEIHA